jgi:hypothetical protein
LARTQTDWRELRHKYRQSVFVVVLFIFVLLS